MTSPQQPAVRSSNGEAYQNAMEIWGGTDPSQLTDEELLRAMVAWGSSGWWLEKIGSERAFRILQDRFAERMTWHSLPLAERIRHRLGCLLLKERSSSNPFYAAKDEAYWLRRQLSAWNV